MRIEELDLKGLDAINNLIKKGWTIQINHHMSVMTDYLNPDWYGEREIYNVQMGEINEITRLLSDDYETIRECFEELNEQASYIISKKYLDE